MVGVWLLIVGSVEMVVLLFVYDVDVDRKIFGMNVVFVVLIFV